MNLALVHRRFTEQGGTERFLVGLARHLLAKGHDVHVYCNSVRPDLRELPLTLHHLPMLRPAKALSLWWSSGSVGSHEVVMGFGATRGHQLHRAGGGAHQAFLEACRPGWRLDPAQRLAVALDRRAVLGAKRVITPSRQAGEDLVRCYGLPRERLRVVHNGVDCARFRPGRGGKGLVFLGSGFARKGLALAAEVARTLGLPLSVIGGDAHLEGWRRRFPELRFLGAVERPEELLPDFDVMLLPTRYEPYGNACLEAMACGVPAVTTPQNGASEIFCEPGLTGADLHELCTAVTRALEGGNALRRSCREAAQALEPAKAFDAVEAVLRECR